MNWALKPPKDIADAMKPIRSQTECGRIMGISRSAVHYIEKSALAKISQKMRLIYKEEILFERGC